MQVPDAGALQRDSGEAMMREDAVSRCLRSTRAKAVAHAAALAAFAVFFAFSLVLIGPLRQEGAADEAARGPAYPAIEDEYADALETQGAPITVTLANQATGQTHIVQTFIGRITLPEPSSLGFSEPLPGALFVGWSSDAAGTSNVYAANQVYPDNGTNSAKLKGDATVYAIWLLPGQSDVTQRACYYIRLDGRIPFEPGGNGTASYAPAGTLASLTGTVRRPVAIANNLEAVASDILAAPADTDVASVLADYGAAFDPQTQKVLWYVVKPRNGSASAWNVNGIVMDKGSHLLAYEPNGGCSNVPDARAYAVGQTVAIDAQRPTRPGFTFQGWSHDPAADFAAYGAGASAALTMPDENVTLYALWKPVRVEVTYVADPQAGGAVGTSVDTVEALSGEGITGSTATPADGYVFVGWYKGAQLVQNQPALDAQTATDNADRSGGLVVPTQFQARFEAAKPAISVRKAVVNSPRNGSYYQVGETVSFRVEVANEGNVALDNIVLSDTLSQLDPVESLQPGESASRSYEYTVTSEDAQRGAVSNVAVATASAPSMGDVEVASAPASCSVLAKENPPQKAYVLFGAYPQAGGTVDRSYELVNADTGEGLEAVTASEGEGYDFSGWYTYDGQLVSDQPRLSAEVMAAASRAHPGRSAWEPTLFVAYFRESGDKGKPPDDPHEPSSPAQPDEPQVPGATVKEPTDDADAALQAPASDGAGADAGTESSPDATRDERTGQDSAKSRPAASTALVRSGDGLFDEAVFVIGMLAAAAFCCGGFALRRF